MLQPDNQSTQRRTEIGEGVKLPSWTGCQQMRQRRSLRGSSVVCVETRVVRRQPGPEEQRRIDEHNEAPRQ
ncbi:hypothetical protein CSUI_008656 [Cystoisospora suis]|uniref:Uncharacterized protein n=1 Tax=Cystoisospora suis TaxID=483139 RepID=A0A2C6KM10_9APIC|nr:hypothetical protein CSUI_008656 [Cystoisospora suis]